MAYRLLEPRFPLGSIFATPGAMALEVDLAGYLRRHQGGDWGDELCKEDREANESALRHGSRILSCYRTPAGDRLYIITEWNRSMTTVMLPSEY
jgi:hypothetical protein